MNQILITKLYKNNKKINEFKTLLIISIISTILFIASYFYYIFTLKKEEDFSKSLSKNYNVYRLFSVSNTNNRIHKESDIMGTISIPKINISYPFFYGINDELLKKSPCRFFGEMPNKENILCIAGHNYNDSRFFSKIPCLSNNDKIIIEDTNKQSFYYYVYDKIEISENELTALLNNLKTKKELILLTCNNKNNKRIILKCKNKAI